MSSFWKKVIAAAILVQIVVPLALFGTCMLASPLTYFGNDPKWIFIAIPGGILACGLAWLAGRWAMSILRDRRKES